MFCHSWESRRPSAYSGLQAHVHTVKKEKNSTAAAILRLLEEGSEGSGRVTKKYTQKAHGKDWKIGSKHLRKSVKIIS